jgi:hypothetical protein
MTNREAQIYLQQSRNNIDRIRELSYQSGIGYCCLGKLETRQAELEYALYGNRNVSRGTLRGNLGFLPAIPLAWLVASGVIAAAGGIGAFLWHRDETQAARDNAEAELIRAQTEQALVDKGLDPSKILPPKNTPIVAKSPIDKLIDVIQLAVIIGGVGLAFGIFKGFGKKT